MYNGKFKNIINLPHHVSQKRPMMSVYDRAVQFAPFSVLSGYEEAVKEEEKRVTLTDDKNIKITNIIYN